MKKLLGLIFLAGLFFSCEGPTGPPGRDGLGTDIFIRDIKVTTNMWQEANDGVGPYLYYEVSEPRLTNYVMNNSLMVTYYRYRIDGDNYDRYVPLSYSELWANDHEYFTVEYTLGYFTIIYRNTSGISDPSLSAYDFQLRVMVND